jgi:L-amino acid N-acyltransferase YncA
MHITMIRQAVQSDAPRIARIYNHYIATTIITFEEELVTADEMERRISDVQNGGLPWLVLEDEMGIAGYAYATKWRVRQAYRYSVETTIYLAPEKISCGSGTLLYERLVQELRERGMHLAIGGIALPNAASVRLHEKLGFEKVAHFKEVGFKMKRWLDVGYWQLTLGPDPDNV